MTVSLPLQWELMEIIISHLSIRDYFSLACSLKTICWNIPITLTWEAWELSYQRHGKSVLPFIIPQIQFLSNHRLTLLLKLNQIFILELYFKGFHRNNTNQCMKLDISLKHKMFLKSCRFGWSKLLEYLLCDVDVDPQTQSNKGILLASEKGHTQCLKLLLDDKRANPNVLYNSPLRYACGNGCLDTVRLLVLDPRVNPNHEDFPAIGEAAANGHLDIVNFLLDVGVSPTVKNNAPIRYSADNGHAKVMRRLLLDPRVDPTAMENYCLMTVCREGFSDCLAELLKDSRVDPSVEENRSLALACEYGSLDCLRLLLKEQRINQTAWNNCPIEIAATCGHSEIVQLLLDEGKYSRESFSKSLEIALANNHPQCFDILSTFGKTNAIYQSSIHSSL